MEAVVAPPGRAPVLPRLRQMSTPLTAIALVGITAVAAGLRGWALARQGLWYDEAMTAWLGRGTPGKMLAGVPHRESPPPLYYLLTWAWARVFGDTEAGL